MSFWLFKISDAGTYSDLPGEAYVFDNTHTVRVRSSDEFLYLKKGPRTYALTGAGRVKRVTSRPPAPSERHNDRVNKVFTAHLAEVVTFRRPLDLSRQTAEGRGNRVRLGLPSDVNAIGWSLSMPRIQRELFARLLDAAFDLGGHGRAMPEPVEISGWYIDDRMALVKVRQRLAAFRRRVLERHEYTCAVCGTRLRTVLDVAHVRSYAADPANRANPANGICLCRFCHAAFDAGQLLLATDGSIELVGVDGPMDHVARVHFQSVDPATRKVWLAGVDATLLLERCRDVRSDAAAECKSERDSGSRG